MTKLDKQVTESDKKQAGLALQLICVVGLVAYLIVSIYQSSDLNPFVLVIFGGGILGTENLLKLIGRDRDVK